MTTHIQAALNRLTEYAAGHPNHDTYELAKAAREELAELVKLTSTLAAIGERLRTQDNRCTADPIFQVRGLRRIYGMDPQWTDDPVWIDNEEGEREVAPPEDMDNPGEYVVQTGYIDVWEVLMVAFTEEGCKEHLRLNGHNYRRYREVQIYADSLNRCPEMQVIRSFLMSFAPPQVKL